MNLEYMNYNKSMRASIHNTLYEYMKNFHPKQDQFAVKLRGKTFRFEKLFKEIDRVAAGLYAMGIRQGDAVMLALPNILQNVVAVYACSRLGAVAAMIHPLYSPSEFEAAVKKIKPKAIFLSDINLRRFSRACGGAKKVICPYLVYGYIGLKRGRTFPAFEGDGEEPMFYMQSGGTSGVPKTIVLSSRSVNAMVENLCDFLGDRFGESNRMLTVMPMFHGFGLCIGVHASLSTNMGVVLMPRFKVKPCAKLIRKEHITTMLGVPRMIGKLLNYAEFKGEGIAHLQDIYVGGDTVTDELVDAFDARMRQYDVDACLSPGYGLTETVTVCALTKRGDFKEGSLGFPIGDTTVMVVDDDLNPVKTGERGELLISGNQLMSGYFDDEEATAAAFCEIDGKRWVRTGDIFSLDEEGRMYFVGRKKRLIKISGMNVFPSDIEGAAQELDFVKEAIALEFKVDGKPFIRLLVEGELDEAQKKQVIAHISRRLSHWNTPREVVCVPLFPRTSIGKTDIKKLEEMYG